MHILLLIPIVYAAAMLDTALGDVVRIGAIAPDLLAMTAVMWILLAGGPRAFLVAGAIALLADLIAPGPLGIGAAWMLLVGYPLCRLRKNVKIDNLAVRVAVVCVAVTLWATGVGLTGYLFSDIDTRPMTVVLRAGGVGIYTAAVSVPLFMVAGWIGESRLFARRQLEGM